MLTNRHRQTRQRVELLCRHDEATESGPDGNTRHEGGDTSIERLVEDTNLRWLHLLLFLNDVAVAVTAVVDPEFLAGFEHRQARKDGFVLPPGPGVVGTVSGNEEVPRLPRARRSGVVDGALFQGSLDILLEAFPVFVEQGIIWGDHNGDIQAQRWDEEAIFWWADGGEKLCKIGFQSSGRGLEESCCGLFHGEAILQESEGVSHRDGDFPKALVVECEEEDGKNESERQAKANGIKEEECPALVVSRLAFPSRYPHWLAEESKESRYSFHSGRMHPLCYFTDVSKCPAILSCAFGEDCSHESKKRRPRQGERRRERFCTSLFPIKEDDITDCVVPYAGVVRRHREVSGYCTTNLGRTRVRPIGAVERLTVEPVHHCSDDVVGDKNEGQVEEVRDNPPPVLVRKTEAMQPREHGRTPKKRTVTQSIQQ